MYVGGGEKMNYKKMAEEHGQKGGCPCEACYCRQQELRRLEREIGALDEVDAIAREAETAFQLSRNYPYDPTCE